MKFKDGKSMLKKIQSGVDLYNPETEKYVYVYNIDGAICVRYIATTETKKVAELAGDENWGSVLGTGGQIWDDPLGWCEDHYNGEWFDTKEWEAVA